MLPIWMSCHVREAGRTKFRFGFPVILVWIVLGTLMIVLLPLVLLAALLTWGRGPGWRLLAVYPLLLAVLWSLSGFRLDVQKRDNRVLFHFV